MKKNSEDKCDGEIELKSLNGTLFSHVWRRGRLALDPLQK